MSLSSRRGEGSPAGAKEFFWLALAASGLTMMAGLFMRSDHPEVQPSFEHMFASLEPMGGAACGLVLLTAYVWAKQRPCAPEAMESFLLRLAANPLPLLLAVTAALAVSAIGVYHNRPLNVDEYSQYFQAQIFAGGSLWGEFPPELVRWLVPDSHENHFFVVSHQTGRIITAYWPGFALLLAPFMKLHTPWLLNPLLTAGSLYLLWLIARRIFSHPEAPAWVLLFSLASPVVTVNALSYYSMTSHLFMNLLFAWLLLDLKPSRLLLAGVTGSIALVLHNPVPHLLFALPWMIWIAWHPGRLRNVGMLVLGYLPLSLLLGYGWIWLKADILHGGGSIKAAAASSPMPPSEAGRASSSGELLSFLLHQPMQLLRSILKPPDFDFLWLRLLAFFKVFSWAVPGLPLLAVMGGARFKGTNPVLKLWGYAAVLTLLVYMFVPVSQGHGWGFRYFHSAWAALPLLAAFFLLEGNAFDIRGKCFLFNIILLSLLVSTGLRFWQVHEFTGRHLAQLPEIAEPGEKERQLVFLHGSEGYFAQDLVQNDPFLRGQAIFLFSRGAAEDRRLLQEYANSRKIGQKGLHSVWLIDGHDDSKF